MPSDPLPSTDVATEMTRLSTAAALIRFEPGLHTLTIGDFDPYPVSPGAGLPALAVQVCSPPSDIFDPVEIITELGNGEAWLRSEGETVVVRSPSGGGVVVVTVYTSAGMTSTLPRRIESRRIGASLDVANGSLVDADIALFDAEPIGITDETPSTGTAELDDTDRELHGTVLELVVRGTNGMERVRSISGGQDNWSACTPAGTPIEALGFTPLGKLTRQGVELRACGRGGRETGWISGPGTCGSRGRDIPLTGFAIRCSPSNGPRIGLVYKGAFQSGYVSPERTDGEMCVSDHDDDPLEAVSIRVLEIGSDDNGH